jgi:hypothetical protein
MGDVEIQEEAELHVREFQVRQELSVVYWKPNGLLSRIR